MVKYKDTGIVVGQRLKTLRSHTNIRQKELAKRLGYSQTTLSEWETGKTSIPSTVLIEIAKIFEVDLNFFDPRLPFELIERNQPISLSTKN